MTALASGTAIVRYFEEPSHTYLGESRQYACGVTTAGEQHSAWWPNLAFFCPHCGEIWARKVFEFQFPYRPLLDRAWSTLEKSCPKHGDGLLLPPTDVFSHADWFTQFSPSLLEREAFLLCIQELHD